MGEVIEGKYRVIGDKRRRLLLPLLFGSVRLGLYVGLWIAVGAWYRFAYAWGMQHVHLQLSELLR